MRASARLGQHGLKDSNEDVEADRNEEAAPQLDARRREIFEMPLPEGQEDAESEEDE